MTALRERTTENPQSATEKSAIRLRVVVRGAVQGVGFRPFVYRLAASMRLPGWVNNSPQGVFVEVEGAKESLDEFLLRLEREKPPRSFIQSLEPMFLDPAGYTTFEIRPSVDDGSKSTLILPDIATCPDCLHDIFDPDNRRYLYPFTNCTNCGPRFSIIEALPYDRPNTTMRLFPMCDECRTEYENPLDRRFHAQPNACPRCGPQLALWTLSGEKLASRHNALLGAAMAVRHGSVVAVKGLGGFLLIADARQDKVVSLLRARKHRQEKPFALMYPSLARAREHCEVSEAEARLLCSPESPIVLLKRRIGSWEVAANVAPNNPTLGVLLPYTPLHHLLMAELDFPVVATSGNLSDEPICTDEHEALERLAGIADLFLVHNRPIARHVDDSIVRVLMGREMVLRRARGYAPLPIRVSSIAACPTKDEGRRTKDADESIRNPPSSFVLGIRNRVVLAVGAHLKNSVALAVGQDVFISQHIGDLETPEATEAFKRVISDFERLYDATPETVVCDAHPDYLSTKFAEECGLPVRKVQHHVAHVYACMAENGITGPALGVSWDGTGYGDDGTVWGGEFFRMRTAEWGMRNDDRRPTTDDLSDTVIRNYDRVAHLRTFRLPGGEKAVREPRRSAIGVLYELLGGKITSQNKLPVLSACTQEEVSIWSAMVEKGVNALVTSSAGRLFDAVSSILGICHNSSFEGQAAMQLEYAIDGSKTDECYSFKVLPENGMQNTPMVVDWGPTIHEMILDLYFEVPLAKIAARFHNTLTEMILEVARLVGEKQVALTGGCFQNAYLLERTVRRLREEGFRPYWHQRVPPNDGGIALGQIVANAEWEMRSAAGTMDDRPATTEAIGVPHSEED